MCTKQFCYWFQNTSYPTLYEKYDFHSFSHIHFLIIQAWFYKKFQGDIKATTADKLSSKLCDVRLENLIKVSTITVNTFPIQLSKTSPKF